MDSLAVPPQEELDAHIIAGHSLVKLGGGTSHTEQMFLTLNLCWKQPQVT